MAENAQKMRFLKSEIFFAILLNKVLKLGEKYNDWTFIRAESNIFCTG
jgi:hypothetical protein